MGTVWPRVLTGSSSSVPTIQQARIWAKEWLDTPHILLVAMVGIWIWTLMLLVTMTGIISSNRTTVQIIGIGTAPSIISAQKMRASMLRMDAANAQELLYGQVGSAEAQKMYEAHREIVSNNMVAASRNITLDGEESLLRSLELNIGRYNQLAAEVRLHNRNGDLPRAVEAMRQATALMQDEIVPATDRLDAINMGELDTEYVNHFRDGRFERGTLFFLTIALVGGMVKTQIFLFRRTTRRFSPFLLLALMIIGGAVFYVNTMMWSSDTDLRLAREDAFASIHALLIARADAYDANSDESLYLVPGFDKAAYDASFGRKVSLIVDRPINDQLTSAVPSSGANFKGSLGDAWRNITFPGEKEALQDALRGWAWFMIADLHIRAAEKTGRHEAAVEWATGPTLGDTPASFRRFEDAMDRVVVVNQTEFDQAIANSLRHLAGGELIVLVALAATTVLTGLALWPRIGEYRG